MGCLFGICFIGHTGPLTDEVFTAIDPTHWVLSIGDKFQDLSAVRDVCLFLGIPTCLPEDKAICLYIKTGNDWSYRGYLSTKRVSEVFPLQWTDHALNTRDVQIGICVEPLNEAISREETIVGSKATFAKRVAMNLYNFMGSFGTVQNGNSLIVPANVFERWYKRFEEKFRRDPDFLTREENKI